MSTIKLSSLHAHAGLIHEKDELYRSELNDGQKYLANAEAEVIKAKYYLKQLRRLDAQSRGVEAAYIGTNDLIKIIEDLLAHKSTITKAFERHEVTEGKCKGWANRTKAYSLDEGELNSALDALAKNANIIVMRKYKVLDDKDIGRSTSYSAALTKLKKQLEIAHTFQDKDDQLISKESAIAAKDAEIERLSAELERDKSEDCKQRAIELEQTGITVAEISRRLGKSRGTIYKYLDSPG